MNEMVHQPASPGGPSLSVLIVNFNSTALLRSALDSLEASTVAASLDVIVVDNASTDFDAEALAREFPGVRFISEPENTTYTAGNNRAFAEARADLILMLNPDTRVEPEALERALAHMDADPQLAGLSAYLIGPDGQLQRYYRRLPTFRDIPVMLFEPILRRTRRGRRFLMLDETFRGPTVVEDPPGAFILFRRAALDGRLLDPGYFNFMSDLELCERLQMSGSVVVFPDVRCHHQRAGAGVGTADPVARLRLYHDFTWGMRRYFRPRLGTAGQFALYCMLVAYWMIRGSRIAAQHPRVALLASRTAVRALASQPPTYRDIGGRN